MRRNNKMQNLRIFTLELLPDVSDDVQEPTSDNSSLTNTENALQAPSPIAKKSIEEDINVQTMMEGMSGVEGFMTVEQNQSIRSEKLSHEEGFCCVMSMHDGVVL